MEKLEIMIKLATPGNIDQVLLEFKEYAQEIDVDFVRKVINISKGVILSYNGAELHVLSLCNRNFENISCKHGCFWVCRSRCTTEFNCSLTIFGIHSLLKACDK